jgi:hypothetical protein
VFFLLLARCAEIPAQDARWASESELKAAFVYHLLPFLDWPQGSIGDRLVVGVAGDGPIVTVFFKFLEGKQIGPHAIETRRVRNSSELKGCNVVVLAFPDSTRTQEALGQIQQMPVVTIGDGKDFARQGGMVAFVPNGNTFRLAVNPRAAERAHIKISSKVLSMAELTTDEAGRQDSK